MSKPLLAAVLLAFGASAATAENLVVKPAVDTASERQALSKLSMCVAERRPRWARQLVSYPYLSSAQATAAAEIVSGHDNCLGSPEVSVAFRTSGVIEAVAEHYLRDDLAKLDWNRVATALSTTAPLNVTEDFALCLASRQPGTARELIMTDIGSADEYRVASTFARGVPSCTSPGERPDVDLQALRALAATALYRGVTAVTQRQ